MLKLVFLYHGNEDFLNGLADCTGYKFETRPLLVAGREDFFFVFFLVRFFLKALGDDHVVTCKPCVYNNLKLKVCASGRLCMVVYLLFCLPIMSWSKHKGQKCQGVQLKRRTHQS